MHTQESLAKISIAKKGENNAMYGIASENHPLYGKKGENHPKYGILHSEETKLKMSIAKGTTIYLYSSDKSILVKTFTSFS